MVVKTASRSSGRNPLAELRRAASVVFPSLLKCAFADFPRKIQRLQGAGARLLRFDVINYGRQTEQLIARPPRETARQPR